jgi:hypothetical protein
MILFLKFLKYKPEFNKTMRQITLLVITFGTLNYFKNIVRLKNKNKGISNNE